MKKHFSSRWLRVHFFFLNQNLVWLRIYTFIHGTVNIVKISFLEHVSSSEFQTRALSELCVVLHMDWGARNTRVMLLKGQMSQISTGLRLQGTGPKQACPARKQRIRSPADSSVPHRGTGTAARAGCQDSGNNPSDLHGNTSYAFIKTSKLI